MWLGLERWGGGNKCELSIYHRWWRTFLILFEAWVLDFGDWTTSSTQTECHRKRKKENKLRSRPVPILAISVIPAIGNAASKNPTLFNWSPLAGSVPSPLLPMHTRCIKNHQLHPQDIPISYQGVSSVISHAKHQFHEIPVHSRSHKLFKSLFLPFVYVAPRSLSIPQTELWKLCSCYPMCCALRSLLSQNRLLESWRSDLQQRALTQSLGDKLFGSRFLNWNSKFKLEFAYTILVTLQLPDPTTLEMIWGDDVSTMAMLKKVPIDIPMHVVNYLKPRACFLDISFEYLQMEEVSSPTRSWSGVAVVSQRQGFQRRVQRYRSFSTLYCASQRLRIWMNWVEQPGQSLSKQAVKNSLVKQSNDSLISSWENLKPLGNWTSIVIIEFRTKCTHMQARPPPRNVILIEEYISH